MSRIGNQPVTIPASVAVKIDGDSVVATGSKGESTLMIPRGIQVIAKDSSLLVTRSNELTQTRALHGTVRSLLNSIVIGVSEGFTKKLELVGLGFRAAIDGENLVMQLGFTHPVRILIPADITVAIEKNTISVSGKDKQRVGEFAAKIRSSKKPEPYKGKGIRYQGEIIKLKQGKAAKGAA